MPRTSSYWNWGYGTIGIKTKTRKDAIKKAKRKLKKDFPKRKIIIKGAEPSTKFYKFGGIKGTYTVSYETK